MNQIFSIISVNFETFLYIQKFCRGTNYYKCIFGKDKKKFYELKKKLYLCVTQKITMTASDLVTDTCSTYKEILYIYWTFSLLTLNISVSFNNTKSKLKHYPCKNQYVTSILQKLPKRINSHILSYNRSIKTIFRLEN